MEVSTIRRSPRQPDIETPPEPETPIHPPPRDPLRRYFSPIFFAVALSFLLPFITVSCQGQPVGASSEVTLTGVEAATGAGTSSVGAWGRDVADHKLPNPLALVALGCAVVGAAVALSTRASRKAAILAATGTVLGLAAFPLHMSITSAAGEVEVRYGWYVATGGAILALGLADLVAARSSFLEPGNEIGLQRKTRLLCLTLGSIGVVVALFAALVPQITLFAAPAVVGFFAALGCAFALIEEHRQEPAPRATQRSLAPGVLIEAAPRNRAAARSVSTFLVGAVLSVLGVIFEAAWLVVVAVVVALASFVFGIVALRQLEPGGPGRWPVLLATSLAFVPIYALAVFGLALLQL